MKQAIEEGFILDVLQSYTTFSTFYNLTKITVDDPQFDTRRAQMRLRQYVETHEYTIRQKAEIMIDHFLGEVIRPRKINGAAKAMIVTSSIVSAIRYKQAFDEYLKSLKSPYQTIIAFTGVKTVKGLSHTEVTMNGFPSDEIPKRFKQSEYRFLIVAEKFQTGFDEPLLHTMYVDKVLADVKAVQTLSRLNRACKPYKTDTFVLDFANSAEDIRKAFEPFYVTTVLSEETNLDRINDLQDAIDAYQIYSESEIREFMTRYLNGADRSQLDPILHQSRQAYIDDLDDTQKIDFKAKSKSFIRTYQFLAQILPVRNVYWESLVTFLKYLLLKLPSITEDDLSLNILQSVDIESYRVERETDTSIRLAGGEELDPASAEARAAFREAEIDLLSNIIREFNTRFGNTTWGDDDKINKFLFQELPEAISKDEEYQNAKQFSDQQNARLTYEKKVVDKFQEFIFDHTEAYRKFTDEPAFKAWLCDALFRMDYDSPTTNPQDPPPQ
jgi:type I restriction enzyme, R subunit